VEVIVLVHTISSTLIISPTPNDAHAASHVAGLDSRTTLHMRRPVTTLLVHTCCVFFLRFCFVCLCVCLSVSTSAREREKKN
jgi:hypothetical protein